MLLRRFTLTFGNRFCTEAKIAPQKFDHILVIDFEATCDRKKQPYPQEIIEFPCVALNSKTLAVDSVFHSYVRPIEHRTLPPFCTELTGIIQDMVDEAPEFPEVLKNFEIWLENEKFQKFPNSAIFATCGSWDLKSALFMQCQFFGWNFPPYFREWINLKKPFYDLTKIWPKGMRHMFEILQIPLKGRLHSGIDDATNLAEIVRYLIRNGIVFDVNDKI